MNKVGIENLEIYNKALAISEIIWTIVEQWNWFHKDTVGKNLVRASDSIVLNISEGYGRFHFKDRRRFCYFARGSLYETITSIEIAKTRNLVDEIQHSELTALLLTLLKKLNNYIKFINKKIV